MGAVSRGPNAEKYNLFLAGGAYPCKMNLRACPAGFSGRRTLPGLGVEGMEFLRAAAELIPALTGVGMAVYDGGGEVLDRFEGQYCFSPALQGIYTAHGLAAFLDSSPGGQLYELVEPLGSRLAAFQAGGCWVLLGPYVEEGWNSRAARVLLAGLGASEAAVGPYKAYRCGLPIARQEDVRKAALAVVGHGGGQVSGFQTVYTGAGRWEPGPEYSGAYADAAVINRRYALEDSFAAAIRRGDRAVAMRALKGFKDVIADLRFISDDMRDQFAGATAIRTMVRREAKEAGLSPVLIDSISQEYAQRMRRAVSQGELNALIGRYVEHFCAEVRKVREAGHSPCVRRAVDYMEANLSRRMTVAEVARAAGVDRHRLSEAFGRETGMTLKRYLARRRCEIAAELLLDGRFSVQQAAAYVGYADNNYFSKVFKEHQGMSPQKYRKARGLPDRVGLRR